MIIDLNGRTKIAQTPEEQTSRRLRIAADKVCTRAWSKRRAERRQTTVPKPLFVAHAIHINLIQEALVGTSSEDMVHVINTLLERTRILLQEVSKIDSAINVI